MSSVRHCAGSYYAYKTLTIVFVDNLQGRKKPQSSLSAITESWRKPEILKRVAGVTREKSNSEEGVGH